MKYQLTKTENGKFKIQYRKFFFFKWVDYVNKKGKITFYKSEKMGESVINLLKKRQDRKQKF